MLTSDPYDDAGPNVIANANHTLDFVTTQVDTVHATANLSFLVTPDAGFSGFTSPLWSSRPNDLAGGVGTVDLSNPATLATDTTGRVYVAWTRAFGYTAGNSEDVYVSVSADGGRSWPVVGRANAASDAGADITPIVRAAPNGRVWVSYLQSWGGFANITLAYTSDHGSTWQGFTNVSNIPYGLLVFYDFAIDPSGTLHVVWSQCTIGLVCSLYYVRSDDGVTWTAPVAFALSPPGGPYHAAYGPHLAVQSPSTVHMVWSDIRVDLPNGVGSVFYSRSDDRGASWSTPVAINQASFGLTPRIAAFGDTVMSVWPYNATGLAWVVSTTDGATWEPERATTVGANYADPAMTVDANGTYHVALGYYVSSTQRDLAEIRWNGPPDPPTLLAVVASGTDGLRVSWTPPAQRDVATYQVYRSADGSIYSLVAVVPATQTAYQDSGLTNGTYWYMVLAVDSQNWPSHDSVPASGTVGPSTADELNGLRGALDAVNATLAAVQNQLNDLRAALGSTTTIIALLIVVIVIQAVMLVMMFRRPKGPAPLAAPTTTGGPPTPAHPEDEL